MRYMVIERFKPGRAREIYARFDARGRMLPPDLKFIDSWIAADLHTCYQLMETEDFSAFQRWTQHWDDLVDFEITAIVSSSEARAAAMQEPGTI